MLASSISAESLTRLLESFLLESPESVLTEDGDVLFDFASSKYSVSGDGKCLLHVWSEDRNIVRRILDAQIRGRTLSLTALRFGRAQPSTLEICGDRNRRSATAQRAARAHYQRLLLRLLEREYSGSRIENVSSKPDLQHSFSPVYTRCLLRTGQSAFAVLGVNAEEPRSSIDSALTFGILWMDYQRQQLAGRTHVKGLKLFLPRGASDVARQRMAHLDRDVAKWQIYEVDERSLTAEEADLSDHGNVETRLVRATDRTAARERFAASIARIEQLVPSAEVVIESSTEIVFRYYGLEFARARMVPVQGSFRHEEKIVFGVGPAEYTLDESTQSLFDALVARMAGSRHPAGWPGDPLFRLLSERWLESLITSDVRSIDERLDGNFVYSQVPAFAASDRAMLDVLTCTVDGRLAILELKADDDLHLALQGLDYWVRVRWHQENGGFTRNGYFAGRELSNLAPLLYLVAPVLRTHPATDTLLRYLSPEIDWSLIQVDEHWRAGIRVVNRKRGKTSSRG